LILDGRSSFACVSSIGPVPNDDGLEIGSHPPGRSGYGKALPLFPCHGEPAAIEQCDNHALASVVITASAISQRPLTSVPHS